AGEVAGGSEVAAGRVHVRVILPDRCDGPTRRCELVRPCDALEIQLRQARGGRAHADRLDDEAIHDILPRLLVDGLQHHAREVVAEVVVVEGAVLAGRFVVAQQIEQLCARELARVRGAQHDRTEAGQAVRQRDQVVYGDGLAWYALGQARVRQVAHHRRLEVDPPLCRCAYDGEAGERFARRCDVERRVTRDAAASREV